MSKFKNITLGCDPEVFLKNELGEYIPSIGKFGGTKEEPLLISEDGHAIQEDNVALEFNIPPSADVETFKRNILFVLGDITKRADNLGLRLAIDSSATFDSKELKSEAACTFGCEPDFDAWTEGPNLPPLPGGNLRTCGGHIHVGYDNPNYDNNLDLIRAMDLFLGVPSVFIDKDIERRTMYGMAGCFRPKSFGAEYRTLSNFWLKSEELIEWAYNSTIKAIEFLNSGEIVGFDEVKLIHDAINNSNDESALLLCEKFSIEIPVLEEKSITILQ
jgi:hypothetical protein